MKPMLAVEPGGQAIRYPVFASVKLDGIRACVVDGKLLSRSLKPIPNHFTQVKFGKDELNGLDGELCVGPLYAKDLMQRTTSGVMCSGGVPDVKFQVFDYWTDAELSYNSRLEILTQGFKLNSFSSRNRHVELLEQKIVHDPDELLAFEETALEQGYEGLILRSPMGRYKYGRSTAREQYLLKIKRFADSEAVVIGFEERMHNANEATLDERGYTKRSSHQENLVPMNTLGALKVKDLLTGIEFSIGTGFDDAKRAEIWSSRDYQLGRTVTYKHFKASGVKIAPRFPVFKAFRDVRDV